mmetsp:Transcript_14965/g.41130  ORF Transcript_14965/g.41130 Transcript_14965/m.41130 type:complete len:127 (+) Transcript_14965:657-1037(+)
MSKNDFWKAALKMASWKRAPAPQLPKTLLPPAPAPAPKAAALAKVAAPAEAAATSASAPLSAAASPDSPMAKETDSSAAATAAADAVGVPKTLPEIREQAASMLQAMQDMVRRQEALVNALQQISE